jgi:hypothetical protein
MSLSPPLPASPTSGELVDWIELTAILDDWPVISHGRIHEAAVSARPFLEPEEISTALRDLRRRASWQSRIYPFERDGSTYRRKPQVDPWPYLLLVVLSNLGFAENLTYERAASAFELLCQAWARDFLGQHGRVVLFGASSKDRPTSFPDAVRWLADQLGLERGLAHAPTSRNDGGVDIVGWVPFPDGYATTFVMLCQATVKSSFVDKASDIDVRLWGNWINFLSEPMRVLVIPHAVSRSDNAWTDVRDRGVALVDRRRIAETYTGTNLDQALGTPAKKLVLQAMGME